MGKFLSLKADFESLITLLVVIDPVAHPVTPPPRFSDFLPLFLPISLCHSHLLHLNPRATAAGSPVCFLPAYTALCSLPDTNTALNTNEE